MAPARGPGGATNLTALIATRSTADAAESTAESADKSESVTFVLSAPAVGIWRDAPAPGSLITPGSYLGQLDILGALHRLYAPKGAHGIAALAPAAAGTEEDSLLRPVGYNDPLLVLDPEGVHSAAAELAAHRSSASGQETGELTFRAPMSGRFYRRPAPDKPEFVKAGDEIEVGATIGLLEVMKTFNRVTYGGDDLPERAHVVEVVPEDQADLATDDVILRIRRP